MRPSQRRNTPAFTTLAKISFAVSCLFFLVGIYNMEAPLVEKGYYLVTGLFMVMSAFVLQKVVRDNQEDDLQSSRRVPPEDLD